MTSSSSFSSQPSKEAIFLQTNIPIQSATFFKFVRSILSMSLAVIRPRIKGEIISLLTNKNRSRATEATLISLGCCAMKYVNLAGMLFPLSISGLQSWEHSEPLFFYFFPTLRASCCCRAIPKRESSAFSVRGDEFMAIFRRKKDQPTFLSAMGVLLCGGKKKC